MNWYKGLLAGSDVFGSEAEGVLDYVDRNLKKRVWFKVDDFCELMREGLVREGDVVVMFGRSKDERKYFVGDDERLYSGDVVLDRGRRRDDIVGIVDVEDFRDRLF